MESPIAINESMTGASNEAYVSGRTYNGRIPLNRTNVLDIIRGAAFYSSGGGGAQDVGETLLEDTVNITGPENLCELAQFNTLSPSDTIVPAAIMGSPEAVKNPDTKDALKKLVAVCLNGWKKIHGNTLNYVCGVETGPANSIAPMFISAMENQGKPSRSCFVLDGDLQGRSVLSLTMLGPYLSGDQNMRHTCYSHICKDDEVPSDALDHDFVTFNGVRYCVATLVVPSEYSTPSEVESYLGSVLRTKSYAPSVLAVIFNPLTIADLSVTGIGSSLTDVPSQAKFYTPLCVPNTVTRSARMGEALRKGSMDHLTNLMLEDGAEFLVQGSLQKVVLSNNQRSDQGYWVVQSTSGKEIAGIFHNETIMVGELKKGHFTPYLTSPSTIGVYLISSSSGKRNRFLTNCEVGSFNEDVLQGHSVQVLIYSLPPAPLLLTPHGLQKTGPSSWGLSSLPGISNSLENIAFICHRNQFRAPAYHNKLLAFEDSIFLSGGANVIAAGHARHEEPAVS